MDWLHSRYVDMSKQETYRCIYDGCIPLKGGSAIVHAGPLSLVHLYTYWN